MSTESLITNPAGESRVHNLMWEFLFTYDRGDGAGEKPGMHQNYAELISEALYNCHQWLQHRHGLKSNQYRITAVSRLIRQWDDNHEYHMVVGKVPITEWPKGNPETPPPRMAKIDNTAIHPLIEAIPVGKPPRPENPLAWLK